MKSIKNIVFLLTIVLLASVLVFTFFLYAGNCDTRKQIIYSRPDPFIDALAAENEEYVLTDLDTDSDYSPGLRLKDGSLYVCYDVQAESFLKNNREFNFTHVTYSTTGIAVKKENAGEISGFNDITDSDLTLYFPANAVTRRTALASLAYALEGEHYTKESALKYLRTLEEKGRLTTDKEKADAFICFNTDVPPDSDFTFILPMEGTLSFSLGVLSERPLNLTEYMHTDASGETVKDYGRFNDVTEFTIRDLRRQVFRTHYMGTTNNIESVMIPLVIIFFLMLWAASAIYRCGRKDIRMTIFVIAVMMIMWIVIRIIKYNEFVPSVHIVLWYSFYIFFTGLPLCLLYIASAVNRPYRGKPVLAKWFIPFAVTAPLLVLCVFTNNLHELVFRFPYGYYSDSDYTYGPVYFVIFAYCFITLLTAIIMLTVKAGKKNGHYGFIWPVSVLSLMILFAVFSANNLSFIKGSDVTIINILFAVILVESIFHSGLVQLNKGYSLLFARSPLHMKLINKDGETVLQSEDNGVVLKEEDAFVHRKEISKGITEWTEDMSSINRLEREIEKAGKKLQITNMFLEKEASIKESDLSSSLKASVFTDLEKELASDTDELSRLLKSLPEEDIKEKDASFTALLLCHIKRKSNLFFMALENESMSSNELMVYLDELSEFAGFSGINSLTRYDLGKNLNIKYGALLYDFCFYLLSQAIKYNRKTVLGYVSEKENILTFDIWMTAISGITFNDSFNRSLKNLKGKLHTHTEEETSVISLCLETGKEEKDE